MEILEKIKKRKILREFSLKYSEIYSKTPNSIFKNFAKPLRMRILSLFNICKKFCKELACMILGMYFCLSSEKTVHLAK